MLKITKILYLYYLSKTVWIKIKIKIKAEM